MTTEIEKDQDQKVNLSEAFHRRLFEIIDSTEPLSSPIEAKIKQLIEEGKMDSWNLSMYQGFWNTEQYSQGNPVEIVDPFSQNPEENWFDPEDLMKYKKSNSEVVE